MQISDLGSQDYETFFFMEPAPTPTLRYATDAHVLEERGISVSALARQVGISQSNLSDMLAGKRDWSKSAIRALSKTFRIRAERFLR